MNRMHESVKHETLLLPQSQAAGGNTTGSYAPVVNAVHDILFTVIGGALAAGKKLTVEVFQADDTGGTNAAELTDCETVFTAPVGGATSIKMMISLDKNLLSKPFVTVKVTNDAAVAVLIAAELIYDPMNRRASLNSPDALKVV